MRWLWIISCLVLVGCKPSANKVALRRDAVVLKQALERDIAAEAASAFQQLNVTMEVYSAEAGPYRAAIKRDWEDFERLQNLIFIEHGYPGPYIRGSGQTQPFNKTVFIGSAFNDSDRWNRCNIVTNRTMARLSLILSLDIFISKLD